MAERGLLSVARVVAKKELVEILRDRRSLVVLLLLPVVLYPLMLIGTLLLATAQVRKMESKDHTVWVEHLDRAPAGLIAHLREVVPSEKGEQMLTLKLEEPPPGVDFAQALSERKAMAVVRGLPEVIPADPRQAPTLEILYTTGVDTSVIVKRQLLTAAKAWQGDLVLERLAEAGLPQETLQPVLIEATDAGPPGALLARILSMLLVVLALTGAFYPALDLGAGEKERGTLETLLLAPVPRVAVALGKFGAVFGVTLVCALLHIVSLGITFSSFALVAPGKMVVDIDPLVLPAMLLVLVPLVALFSALALALATFAASYKEGQSYLTPVMLLGTIPAMAAALPGMDLTPAICLVPVLGATLLLKALLAATWSVGQVVLVVGSSLIYAGLAVRWVATLYQQEEVLWRPVAAKGPDLFGLRGETFGRERVPTFPQAVALGVLGLLGLWFVGMPLQQRPGFLPYGLLVTLVFLVALPSVAYARLLGCDMRETFRLARPGPLGVAAAVLLALGCAGAMLDVQQLQQSWSGSMGEEEIASTEEKLKELLALGPVGIVFLLAVVPGVCEEVMFRGFVLSGLRREGDSVGPVLVTALMFAVFHLDPGRLIPTFLVGAVLGAVVVRTGSLLPAILMHVLYNSSVLGLDALGERLADAGLIASLDPMTPSWALRGGALACLLGGAALLLVGRAVTVSPAAGAPSSAEEPPSSPAPSPVDPGV